MSQSFTIKAQRRTQLGSRSARKLRAEGRIPASIPVSDGLEHVDLDIDEREFLGTRRHHVHLYEIDIDGTVEAALVRELQWNAMGDRINHIEFKRVQLGVETETEVPLEVIGQPKDGVVTVIHPEILIRVLPSFIPDSITVRVGDLGTGSHIKAGDLVLPDKVSLAMEADVEVLVVSAERVVEETTGEEGEAQPEVIGEKKPEADSEA